MNVPPIDPETLRTLAIAAKDWSGLVVIPTAKEVGGMLADSVRQKRFMRQMRCLVEAKKFMEENGLDPVKVLPDVFIVPVLEEAANIDDENLSEMFARLLAAGVAEGGRATVHPSFAKTLGQLSTLNVKVLNLIDTREREECLKRNLQEEKSTDWQWSVEDVVAKTKESENGARVGDIRMSVGNLKYLGLWEEELFAIPFNIPVQPRQQTRYEPASISNDGVFADPNGTLLNQDSFDDPQDSFDPSVTAPLPLRGVAISQRGRMFLRACNNPATYWRQLFRIKEEKDWEQQKLMEEQERRQNKVIEERQQKRSSMLIRRTILKNARAERNPQRRQEALSRMKRINEIRVAKLIRQTAPT